MLIPSALSRASRSHPRGARPRRGVALVFVLMFVMAMAALAMSSIFMGSSSTLLAKSYDRERDLRYAADAALAIGKARINGNPSLLLPPSGSNFRALLVNANLLSADSTVLPGIVVNVYVGITGSSSGQNGRFGSIVAQAIDTRTRASFIRRLEVTQESFAKYAYWSNLESNGSTSIFFNNGDEIWGPAWSNDTIHIGSGGATFHDVVGTAKAIDGKSYGTFVKPPTENQAPILLPSMATLTLLASYAAPGNDVVTSVDGPTTDESRVLDRIEFVAFDMNNDSDSTSDGEGFFRAYKGKLGNEKVVRGDWLGTTDASGNPVPPALNAVERCGDWHYAPLGNNNPADSGVKFYPASIHAQSWFHDQILAAVTQRPSKLPSGYTTAAAYAAAEQAATLVTILSHARARCYLGGDPHLVATDRVAYTARPLPQSGTYSAADVQKGGEDSTFTPAGRYGSWQPVPQTALTDTIVRARRLVGDGRYLNPLSRAYNSNTKGVIYATGNVGVSGVLNGLVTVYAKGDIVILDDLRYANDPVKGVCHDMLGMISDYDIVIADNAINTPVATSSSGANNFDYVSMDDTKDLYVHGVAMALGTSFRVQNYDQGPTHVNDCDDVSNGRGCIYLSGGIIQNARGKVGRSTGTGFSKRYSYDRCAVRNPPPYFPTTGRFQDNRYLELDPSNFKPDLYFQSLTPTGP